MLRFRVQIKKMHRAGTQKYKGLDILVSFTCEKPAYYVLYLITFKFNGEHQALVLHRNMHLSCFSHVICMLRFRVQIKVLRVGTQKYKRPDSLVPFTCEKLVYRIPYLRLWKSCYPRILKN